MAGPRLIVGMTLLAAFAAFLIIAYGADADSLFRRAAAFYAFAQRHVWLLMFLYVLRPLFLLPASFVILLTGMLYGGCVGEAVAVAGLTLSSSIEFLFARASFTAVLRRFESPALEKLRERIGKAPFRAVLLARLCFIPFDLVNIGAAAARAPLRAFMTGTALGVIPTTLPIVMTGAAIDFDAWVHGGQLWPHSRVATWPYVTASVLVAILVACVARRANQREPKRA